MTEVPPKRIGRPPEPVPQDIADRVVNWIEQGKPLAELCRQPGMPAQRTIDQWRELDEPFRARVAHARDVGYDVIAASCVDIADERDDGDPDDVARRKLRIETRLKLLACWDPRRYGQARDTAGPSVNVTVTTGVPASKPTLRIDATDASGKALPSQGE